MSKVAPTPKAALENITKILDKDNHRWLTADSNQQILQESIKTLEDFINTGKQTVTLESLGYTECPDKEGQLLLKVYEDLCNGRNTTISLYENHGGNGFYVEKHRAGWGHIDLTGGEILALAEMIEAYLGN